MNKQAEYERLLLGLNEVYARLQLVFFSTIEFDEEQKKVEQAIEELAQSIRKKVGGA